MDNNDKILQENDIINIENSNKNNDELLNTLEMNESLVLNNENTILKNNFDENEINVKILPKRKRANSTNYESTTSNDELDKRQKETVANTCRLVTEDKLSNISVDMPSFSVLLNTFSKSL